MGGVIWILTPRNVGGTAAIVVIVRAWTPPTRHAATKASIVSTLRQNAVVYHPSFHMISICVQSLATKFAMVRATRKPTLSNVGGTEEIAALVLAMNPLATAVTLNTTVKILVAPSAVSDYMLFVFPIG